MVLIGGDPNKNNPGKSKQVDNALASLLATIRSGAVQVLGIEWGRAYPNFKTPTGNRESRRPSDAGKATINTLGGLS